MFILITIAIATVPYMLALQLFVCSIGMFFAVKIEIRDQDIRGALD